MQAKKRGKSKIAAAAKRLPAENSLEADAACLIEAVAVLDSYGFNSLAGKVQSIAGTIIVWDISTQERKDSDGE